MTKHTRASDFVPDTYAFRHSDRIWIRGEEVLFQFTDAAGHTFALRDRPAMQMTVSDVEIVGLMDAGELRTIPHGHLKAPEWRRELVEAPGLADLSPKMQRVVWFRKTYCDAVLQLESEGKVTRSDAMLASIMPRLALMWNAVDRAGQKDWGFAAGPTPNVSPATLRRWLRVYEAACFEAVSLADKRRRSGNHTPRLQADVQKFVEKYALRYCIRTQPSMAKIYLQLKARIQEWNRLVDIHNRYRPRSERRPHLDFPSRATLARAIGRLGEFKVMAGRHGEEYARRKLAITAQDGLDVTRPLERVETDCWQIPLFAIMQRHPIWKSLKEEQKSVIKQVRLWLDTVICCASRVVLAARIVKTPTAEGKVQTLAMSLVDKSHYAEWADCENDWSYSGTWESVAGDTGSEVLNYRVQGAIVDLTATSLLMPAGAPAAKGRQERFYRTIANGLIAGLSGYSFENVVRKGDYDAEANAIINIEELGRLIVRWIVDVYHRSGHAGLGGAMPHNTWVDLRRKFRVLPPPDADRMRHIMGITLERQIGGKGVRVLGLMYQSEELQKLRLAVGTDRVVVRIDSENIGSISVQGVDGWITVPCKRRQFEGVPLFQWILAAKQTRESNSEAAAVHEPSVLRALRDIERFSNAAMARAGIAAPVLTHKSFAKLETSIFKSFRFMDEGEGNKDFLQSSDDVGERYGETSAPVVNPSATDTVEAVPATPSGPAPALIRQNRKFFMED